MNEKHIYQVLIVDDEPYVLQAVASLLEDQTACDLEIFRAGSALAALATMRRRRIDILITDIQMPGMDGLQLAHIVRQRWPDCRTIMLTAYDSFTYVRSALHEDVSGYVLKSESDEMLIGEFLRVVQELETQMDDMKQLISQQSAADRQCVSFLKQETMKNLIAGRYAHDPRRYAEALTALSCPSPTEPVNLFCILSPKNPDFKAAYGQLICLSERYLSNAAGFTCFVMEQDRFWGVLQLNEDLEINALQDMLSSVVEHYSRLSNQVAVCLLSHSAKNAEEFCAHCARIKGYNGEIADSPYVHIITPKTAPLTSKAILTSVMEYIDRNLSGDVSLETLAKASGYNPSYLSRLFLQHMGINLSNYIARQKMKAIVRLLNCPEYSLDQIMEIAGFENKSTFNRFVKRMTGYSPKRYRENLTDIEKAAPGQAASLTGVSFPSDDEPEKQ